MEKFTVDIDKVLDDFEFNEDRASEIPSTSCLNQSSNSNSTKSHNAQYTLPPSYEETMTSYETQNDTSYYKKPSQKSDNLYPKNTNNYSTESFSNLDRYKPVHDPPSYDSLQYSTYNNNGSYFNNKTDNFVLKSDELYADSTSNSQPVETFSTEMLKIRLFQDENHKNDKNLYPAVPTSSSNNEYQKNNSMKKNSVSNVFNSLQEYINTDVVDVMPEPIKNNLTYSLLPKIENGQMNLNKVDRIENSLSSEPDLLDSITSSSVNQQEITKNNIDLLDSTTSSSRSHQELTNNTDLLDSIASSSTSHQEIVKNNSDLLDSLTSSSTSHQEIGKNNTDLLDSITPPPTGNQNIITNKNDLLDSITKETVENDLLSSIKNYPEIVRDQATLIDSSISISTLPENINDNLIDSTISSSINHQEVVENSHVSTDHSEVIEIVQEDNEVVENNIVNIQQDENIVPNDQNEVEEAEVQENKIIEEVVKPVEEVIKKPIGFDSITVEVSDAEIEDYLKDLEDHLEEEVIEVEQKEIVENIEKTQELITSVESDRITETVNKDGKEIITDIVEQISKTEKIKEKTLEEDNVTLEQTENEANEAKANEKLQPQVEETTQSCETGTQNVEKKIEENVEVVEEKTKENFQSECSKPSDVVCEEVMQKPPKLSTICRPNSLDIVSSIDDESEKCLGPPGETPMNKTTLSMIDKEASSSEEFIENNKKTDVVENTSDFSPSTSEVSSVENQEDGVIFDETSPPPQQTVIEYDNHSTLGKRSPYWIPDTDTNNCMHCGFKFTVIKRRHHCRACGMVLCSKCCNMKAKLEYLGNIVSRVCVQCYEILNKDTNSINQDTSSDSANNSPAHFVNQSGGQPNPNNPMEYCSTVPPLKQLENQRPRSPPTVMVPVGVLKRQGSNKGRSEKTVMFSDGIRPGCDLTELDNSWESRPIRRQNKRVSTPPGQLTKVNKNLPLFDESTLSYIPSNDCLPPTVNFSKPENTYTECSNNESVVEMLRNEILVFAIQRNLNVYVKIVNLDCCVNKQVWCFTTKGLSSVGQDEIVILLEVLEKENRVPKDVFLHLNNIYMDAAKGNTITEMGFSIENKANFLESKNHAGFLYVRPTYQCLQNIILPSAPYLFGILIHRWETPWVKIFPLRLLLRLGAEYRYYPCPIISTRNRESLFVEIGHTIINLLADFRNYSYTLPSVRGLIIHMEEKKTSVLIPKNRYDQVMRAMNNSSDHILAFAGNFSTEADSHLVCIQDTSGSNDNSYSTHAINIQNKPRKVTGASFIILNGALKTSSGLTAKSSVIEDGLMIQILPDQMVKLRDSLRNMKNFEISCGCVNSETDEYVNIIWTDNDVNFNIGVKSPIDNQAMDGVPSIRVHNGVDHIGSSKLIRWTEVFILQNGDENPKTQDPVDISKLSENISRSTCEALVKYLDLLATNNFTKVGIRVTLHSENVSYEAGSNGIKFAPIYMNSLDNALIPVLHNITSKNLGNNDPIILELIFHILNS
ncbi:zinc finger FYVE domain-containing protein 16 [Chrysoperla carnea]|uniref:zinc finger FYVE domain-containing protein 16 n=1 Tax=Chrysoperla carnea TaxID=189513 RepID=UPI001D061CD0|nr:zinc finger FYVE domain-containing protein 16 [Chrysoperla carnea]